MNTGSSQTHHLKPTSSGISGLLCRSITFPGCVQFTLALRTVHAQVRRQRDRIALRVGVTKRVNSHVFRHSRITHLVRYDISESVIKEIAWDSQDSRMLKTCRHLTAQDVNNEMLWLYGIEVAGKKKERGLNPHQCAYCSTINAPASNYCSTCGHPVTEKAQRKVTNSANKI